MCEAVAGEIVVNRLPLIASLVCAVGGVVGGYYLVPGDAEKLTMLVRDGHDELALAKADELFDRGVREPTLLMQAFMMNQRAGEYSRAATILDDYFKERPDDVAAWRKVADVFKASGQSELYLNALENVVRLSRDPGAVSALSGIYRLRSDDENELRVLSIPKSADLTVNDAVRLADLLVAQKRVPQAVSILELFDQKQGALPEQGRIQLFTALLDQQDFTKAVDRALAWEKGKQPSALLDVFVVYLLRAGADDQAIRLATSAGSGKTMAQLARLLSDEGRYDLIERVVSEWIDYARKLPGSKLDGYMSELVDTARVSGIGSKLFDEMFRTLAGRGVDEVEASFVQTMFDHMGYAGVAPFRPSLGPGVMALRPVLAARLLLAERNELAARHFLMTTYLPSQSSTARFQWLALAEQLLAPQELGAELAQRAQDGSIPPEMKRAVLDAIMKVGSQAQIMTVWHAFFDAQNSSQSNLMTGLLLSANNSLAFDK